MSLHALTTLPHSRQKVCPYCCAVLPEDAKACTCEPWLRGEAASKAYGEAKRELEAIATRNAERIYLRYAQAEAEHWTAEVKRYQEVDKEG
jgi:hypothetical protein